MDHHPAGYIEKHRLAGLQDGVYAIAVTLLVLELKLPNLGEHVTSADVWAALVELRPKIMSWLLSFWVLSIFWSGETRLLRRVKTVDQHLFTACLAQLALASLLPFTTAIDGEYGDLTATSAVYSLHIATMAMVSAWRVGYVRRHPELVAEEAAQESLDESKNPSLWTVFWTLVAFALSFVVPGYNMLALLPLALTPWVKRAVRRTPAPPAP